MNNTQAMRGRVYDPCHPRPQQAPACCCPNPSCCAKPSCCPKPVVCDFAELPLAMAYVPMQVWSTPYTPEQAFCRGTLFPQLDLPLGGMR